MFFEKPNKYFFLIKSTLLKESLLVDWIAVTVTSYQERKWKNKRKCGTTRTMTVHYGKRSRRFRSPAPPPPPLPRRPRDTHPEDRSYGRGRTYASVARGPRTQHTATHSTHRSYQRHSGPTRPEQSHHNRAWRRTPTGGERRAGMTQWPEEAVSPTGFRQKVRILHHIIKATHHLNNVSRGDPPVMITKMTQTLCSFIKPSNPLEKNDWPNYGQCWGKLGIFHNIDLKRTLPVGHQVKTTVSNSHDRLHLETAAHRSC